jgi:hypothetical protein
MNTTPAAMLVPRPIIAYSACSSASRILSTESARDDAEASTNHSTPKSFERFPRAHTPANGGCDPVLGRRLFKRGFDRLSRHFGGNDEDALAVAEDEIVGRIRTPSISMLTRKSLCRAAPGLARI